MCARANISYLTLDDGIAEAASRAAEVERIARDVLTNPVIEDSASAWNRYDA